jgi:SpoVK/Ycf46/Vps4 family AAA+-type ATPase
MLDSDVDLGKLVELTEGWTGADIGSMVNTAALSAIKERITADSISRKDQQHNNVTAEKSRENKRNKVRLKVSMKHFQSAIEKVNRKNKTSSQPS